MIARSDRRPVSIVIPCYGDGSIASPLMNSLEQCASELQALGCSILLVDDSGGLATSGSPINTALHRLGSIVPCVQVQNRENLGFVRSANIGLKRAIESHQDCILLNSDTVLFPGAFSEMQSAAYTESAIGFVNPRSNNATICSLPHQDRDSPISSEAAYAAYAALAPRIPRLQFVPTAVGFCMYVKHETLASIGVFDEVYGRGYNEENDLVLRGNRAGYSAVLANRAFVYHCGGASFSGEAAALETKNAAILDDRYPEYRPAVNSYYAGPQYTAELLLYGLPREAEKPRIAVIQSSVGSHGDVLEALRVRFDVQILRDTTDHKHPFAAALAVDPSREAVAAVARLAPVNAFMLTGTSAFDRLDTRMKAEHTWRFMVRYGDIVAMGDPSQLPRRLGTSAAVIETSTLPDALTQALERCTVAGVADRLAALAPELAADRSGDQLSLMATIEAQKKRIEELEASFSWRVTSPVRGFHRLLFGQGRGSR